MLLCGGLSQYLNIYLYLFPLTYILVSQCYYLYLLTYPYTSVITAPFTCFSSQRLSNLFITPTWTTCLCSCPSLCLSFLVSYIALP